MTGPSRRRPRLTRAGRQAVDLVAHLAFGLLACVGMLVFVNLALRAGEAHGLPVGSCYPEGCR